MGNSIGQFNTVWHAPDDLINQQEPSAQRAGIRVWHAPDDLINPAFGKLAGDLTLSLIWHRSKAESTPNLIDLAFGIRTVDPLQ